MATRSSSVRVQRDSQQFTVVLTSAILEWLLIFLLFIDALFSYLVTKFAHFCDLQTPCLLCSRLDHVLGDGKPGFYRDLICGAHKSEISSLVFCHIHDKLADVHGMCEGCLFSFATEKKSNSETYRLLVGKLGTDLECSVDQDPLLKHPILGSSSKRHCSCCNGPWTLRPYTHTLLQNNSIGPEVPELDIPLPGAVGHSRLHLHDGLKKRREKSSESVISSNLGYRGFDPLSHVGYTELKITSDSESEVPFSDDDDGGALVRETDDFKEEFVAQCVLLQPHIIIPDILLKTPSDDLAPEQLIHTTFIPDPSLLVPHEQPDVRESHDATSSASAVAIGHGLEELNWHQVEQEDNPPALSELVSLGDASASSNVTEVFVEVSVETLNVMGTGDIGQTFFTDRREICKLESGLTTTIEAGLNTDQVFEASGDILDVVGTGNIGQASITESGEVSECRLTPTTGPGLKTDQVLNGPGAPMPNLMDLSDAYGLDVVNNGSQVSSMLAEQLTAKDSARVSEDLKPLLSQISSARGLDLSLNDMSPRVHGHDEELKISDASSSIGLQMLQKRISIERNECGFESLDGSIVSETEGETVVDRLKRQVDYDRKSMTALYKELEEERNASAIAANQAMAMITRLQEEKAGLHMEALQYLRMMEEQSEYDVEALQKANDLLAEREKQIQDLEAEVEIYRKKIPKESMVENIEESVCDLKGGDMRAGHLDVSCIENNTSVPCNSLPIKNFEGSDKPVKTEIVCGNNSMSVIKDPLLDFEDERIYISQCLKKLEKKLHLFSNGGYSGKEAHEVNDLEHLHFNEPTHENSQIEEDGFSVQKDTPLSRGGSPVQERCTPSSGDHKENNHIGCDGQDSSVNSKETDLVALENEVSDLNERLEALEADQSFLEHTINSLQNGDGVQFIQEIAHHLREFRRIGIREREQAVA